MRKRKRKRDEGWNDTGNFRFDRVAGAIVVAGCSSDVRLGHDR